MSWRLSKNYLFGRNSLVPKAVHLLSLIGIIIGVVALLIVSSVMNGLRDDMMMRITETKAEIRVYGDNMNPVSDYDSLIPLIESVSEVRAVSPVIVNELLIHKGENIAAVETFGIDVERHSKITNLEKQIRIGSLESFQTEENGIAIGLDLSVALGATVGEYVRVSAPQRFEPTPFGLLPKTKNFKVIAIFSSGMPQYDQNYTYISLNSARFFSGYNREIDLLQVKIDNPHRSKRVASDIRNATDRRYLVEDWSVFDSSLFEAMRLEKIVMLTVLALMLIISGFNMACSSIRMVSEKQVEIGLLKAIGMKTIDINRSFLTTNLIIGISGIIIGIALSSSFIILQQRFKLIEIPVPGFPMQWLPVSPNVIDFLTVSVLVLLITVAATIIPLRKIKEMEPIKVIRQML